MFCAMHDTCMISNKNNDTCFESNPNSICLSAFMTVQTKHSILVGYNCHFTWMPSFAAVLLQQPIVWMAQKYWEVLKWIYILCLFAQHLQKTWAYLVQSDHIIMLWCHYVQYLVKFFQWNSWFFIEENAIKVIIFVALCEDDFRWKLREIKSNCGLKSNTILTREID